MASSSFRRLLLPLVALLLPCVCSAANVTYDFEIGWVRANPDGKADRSVIGINGQWPVPVIEVNVGDRLVVNVLNSLGNQSTSLHFHGLFMNGSTHMDGPVQISQCTIPSGSRFTYDFEVRTIDLSCTVHLLNLSRSTNPERTGTIRTKRGSIQTACAAL